MLLSGLVGLHSSTTSDHLLRGGTAHRGRGLPTPVVNQENARKLKGQSDGGNSSTERLPFQVYQVNAQDQQLPHCKCKLVKGLWRRYGDSSKD